MIVQTEEPITPESIATGIEQIYYSLNAEHLNLDQWIKAFENFNRFVKHIPQYSGQINPNSAQSIVTHSVGILDILVDKPSIWDNFPIFERVQHATDIYSAIGTLSVLINTKLIEKDFSKNNVKFDTRSFEVVDGASMQYSFESEFSYEIAYDGLGYKAGERIFATSALVKNLSPYLSMEYVVNSKIMSVVVQDQLQRKHDIWYK